MDGRRPKAIDLLLAFALCLAFLGIVFAIASLAGCTDVNEQELIAAAPKQINLEITLPIPPLAWPLPPE